MRSKKSTDYAVFNQCFWVSVVVNRELGWFYSIKLTSIVPVVVDMFRVLEPEPHTDGRLFLPVVEELFPVKSSLFPTILPRMPPVRASIVIFCVSSLVNLAVPVVVLAVSTPLVVILTISMLPVEACNAKLFATISLTDILPVDVSMVSTPLNCVGMSTVTSIIFVTLKPGQGSLICLNTSLSSFCSITYSK